jgi:hypothetical protein
MATTGLTDDALTAVSREDFVNAHPKLRPSFYLGNALRRANERRSAVTLSRADVTAILAEVRQLRGALSAAPAPPHTRAAQLAPHQPWCWRAKSSLPNIACNCGALTPPVNDHGRSDAAHPWID